MVTYSNSSQRHPKNTRELNRALARLLVGGGDSRLLLEHTTGLNGYGCSPWPRPQEISFASATASTISERARSVMEIAYRKFMGHSKHGGVEQAFAHLVEQVRQDIKTLFELDPGTEVVLSPSGTDSELQALFLSRRVLKNPVVNVIAAADETGSGVGLAVSGCHYDVVTSGGRQVIKGQTIAGLAVAAKNIAISARDRRGQARPIDEVDEEVRRHIGEAIRSGFGVILHVMDQSKTGNRYPSDDCAREIISTHRSSVQIVADACQARLSRARLRWYLGLGCMVLITGSKFYTGPAFSGALLVPELVATRACEAGDDATGLTAYSSRHDWPASWAPIRSSLDAWMNIGQLLRWVAALEETRGYYAVPELFRKLALQEFSAVAARSIARHPCLQPLSVVDPGRSQAEPGDEFSAQSIFSFLVKHENSVLTLHQSRMLYRALNEDVSSLFPASKKSHRNLAARLCHIGQPIAVKHETCGVAGALRLSADARFVSRCWSERGSSSAVETMRSALSEINIVLNKFALLNEHFDLIVGQGGEPAQ